jgi:hypothetical protein
MRKIAVFGTWADSKLYVGELYYFSQTEVIMSNIYGQRGMNNRINYLRTHGLPDVSYCITFPIDDVVGIIPTVKISFQYLF